MSPILLVILCVGAGVVVLVLVLRLTVGAVAKAGAAAISSAYRPEDIVLSDPLANCFGKQSLGAFQLRGNGGLVLTRERLHFLPLAGAPAVDLALNDVTEVQLVRSFLGKTVGRKLLHVSWGASESADATAFVVKEPERWHTELDRLRARS